MIKTRSTINTDDYIIYSSIFFVFAYLLYFFSFYTHYAWLLQVSSVKAFNIITIFSFIGCLIVFRHQRHIVTIAASITFPFCLFTLINMSSIYREPASLVILLIIAMAVVCLIIIRKDYTMSSGKSIKLSKTTLKRCAIAAHMIFTLLMSFCVMCVVVYNAIVFQVKSSAVVSSEEQQTMNTIFEPNALSNYTTDNFRNELEGFGVKNWSVLSKENKLDLLQMVANIEANEMGLAQPFIVKSYDLGRSGKDTYTTGCYESSGNTIYIDNTYLETENSSYWILQTLCHECYHGWQHALIKLYYEAGSESKQLKIFSDVREYIENISSYDEALKNFDEYYNLKLESTAREYGEDHAKDYYLLSMRIDPSNKDHFDFPEDKDK